MAVIIGGVSPDVGGVTVSGTPTSGQSIVASSGTAAAWGAVTTVNGIAFSGTPSVGYVPTATSASAATWQAGAALPALSEGQVFVGNASNQTTEIGPGASGQALIVPQTSSFFVSFDGAHDGTTGSDAGLPTGNLSGGVAWDGIVNFTNATEMAFWSYGTQGSNTQLSLAQIDNVTMAVYYGGGTHVTWTVAAFNDGANHHVGVAYNGTAWTLYIDGVGQGAKTPGGAANITLNTLKLAGDNATFGGFNGKSAYQAFYGANLSAARFLAHYNAIAAGTYVATVTADSPVRFFQQQEAANATIAVDTGASPVNLTYTAGVTPHQTGSPLPSSTIPTFQKIPGDTTTTFQSSADQTSGRAIDGTVYTNTTGRRMYVLITVTNTGATGTASVALVGDVGGVVNVPQGTLTSPALTGAAITMQGVIMVDPGGSYSATKTDGTGATSTLVKWIEIAE